MAEFGEAFEEIDGLLDKNKEEEDDHPSVSDILEAEFPTEWIILIGDVQLVHHHNYCPLREGSHGTQEILH